ncbi:MAG: VOC family protein [Deltaproteobacteria bacterium]|nr:VOC family protein [Deltaproteobacteria bacterium]
MDAAWHHVAICVKDMDRALGFYRDLLGFEVDWERDHYSGEAFSKVVGLPGADARVVMLKGYGGRVELFHYYSHEGEDRGSKKQCDTGITHMAFNVKNVQELYERLSKAGVEFNCPPQNLRPGVWGTYMKDPEGVTIEVVQYD